MEDTQTPETWFKSPVQRAHPRKCAPPYDKIHIGCDPVDGFTEENAKKFDAIINVSCSPCAYFYPAYPGQYMHWVPINEMGYWGLAPFYWFKKVMDFHHSKGHRVYVHCHAGAYRSPTFVVYWLMSLGLTLDEALEIEYNDPVRSKNFQEEEGGRFWNYRRRHPYMDGNINYKTVEMLRRMSEKDYSFGGIINHPGGPLEQSREIYGSRHWTAKWHKWFCFYYQPKWWLSKKTEPLRYWLAGNWKEPTGSYSSITHHLDGSFAARRRKLHYWYESRVRPVLRWPRSKWYHIKYRIHATYVAWQMKRHGL